MPASPVVICNGSIGFTFLLTANGTGGTSPKTYIVTSPTDFGLKEPQSDNSAIPAVQQGGWASDPGDSVFPNGSRDYAIAGLAAPNNIRLSQIPTFALTSSHGISRGIGQENLPTSSNFNDPRLNTATAGINANPNPTIGNIGGFSRITVTLFSANAESSIWINGGIQLTSVKLSHTFNVANLGLIQICNLRAATEIVGVHCEVSG